ncbi:hypothetical protein LTR53_019881, partial [Teratosphaeriaceae sp. CCFEE 6253]
RPLLRRGRARRPPHRVPDRQGPPPGQDPRRRGPPADRPRGLPDPRLRGTGGGALLQRAQVRAQGAAEPLRYLHPRIPPRAAAAASLPRVPVQRRRGRGLHAPLRRPEPRA